MKIKILIFISFSLLLAECASNSITSEDVYEIDILKGYSNVKDFNLSDIAKDVHYVKLENNPDAIFSIGVPIINDSFILIKGFLENRLILFRSDGKFICNIGRSGQGPGEFLNLQDVYLHPHEPKILVHDGTSSKLLVFSTDGECLREFNYSNRYKDPLEKVCYTKEGEIQVVLRRPFSEVEEYALVRTLNNEFEETNFYHKITNEFNAIGGTTGFSNYWINNGQLYLHEFFYDRVFTQKNDDFTPIFQFSFTNNHSPAYYVPRDPGVWNYNSIPFVTGVGKYLLMYANLPDIEQG